MELQKVKRNELGLLDDVDYKFDENGIINWRSLIKTKYLYVNQDNFKKRGEPIPESIENIQDMDLIIKLSGLRDLAYLRGFTSYSYRPIVAGLDYAASVCHIDWIGNFETEMKSVSSEAMACASTYNTNELTQIYLIEMAENRSFCRAVRNFLRISIVSKEELPPSKKSSKSSYNTNVNPTQVLENLMKEKGRSFLEVREKLIAEGNNEFENYKTFSDIPGDKAFQLVDRFKNLKENKLKTKILGSS